MSDYDLLTQCDIYSSANDGCALLQFVEKNRFRFQDPNLYYFQKTNALIMIGLTKEAYACACIGLFYDDQSPIAWINIGLCYTSEHKYEKALEAFEKASSLGEQTLFLFQNLGIAHYHLHHYDKAIEIFENIVDQLGKDPVATTYLALSYHKSGQEEKADQYFMIALSERWLNIRDLKLAYKNCLSLGYISRAYGVLACIYQADSSTGRWVEQQDIHITLDIEHNYALAKKLLKAYLKHYPEDPWAYTQIALAAAYNNEPKSCQYYLKKIHSSSNKNTPSYYLATGLYFHATKSYTKAINALKQVKNIHTNVDATLALANSYLATNQKQQALRLLKRSQKNNAYQTEINDLLTQLTQ